MGKAPGVGRRCEDGKAFELCRSARPKANPTLAREKATTPHGFAPAPSPAPCPFTPKEHLPRASANGRCKEMSRDLLNFGALRLVMAMHWDKRLEAASPQRLGRLQIERNLRFTGGLQRRQDGANRLGRSGCPVR